MNLTKSSAELDLAVAEAVGFDAYVCMGKCYLDRGPKLNSKLFRPSRDMTDAWKAAEKVELFSPQGHQGCLHGSVDSGYVVAERSGKLHIAPIGPLAICAAIIETQKGETDAPNNG